MLFRVAVKRKVADGKAPHDKAHSASVSRLIGADGLARTDRECLQFERRAVRGADRSDGYGAGNHPADAHASLDQRHPDDRSGRRRSPTCRPSSSRRRSSSCRPAFRPQVFPSSTPLPVSIVILSPVSGNVVAGNVQILGSAIHPQFLQYQVEFGPDPNPGNLWFPATTAVTTPGLEWTARHLEHDHAFRTAAINCACASICVTARC